jgi:hypothetical protein
MQQGKGMERRQEDKYFKFIKNKRPSIVDMAKVHIGGFNQHRLHVAGSTNTIATKDLADVDSIGDGIGNSGEL